MLLQKGRRQRDAFAAVAALVAMLVGIVLLGASSEVDRLWAVLGMAVVGLVLVAVALLWANDRLDHLLVGWRRRWVFPLGLLVGAGLLAAATFLNWEWLGLVAMAVGAAAAMGTHTVLKLLVPGRISDHSVVRTLWLPAELVGGGLGAVWALDGFTGFAWAGLLAAMLGTILLKQQMAELLYTRRVGRRRAFRVSIDVAVVGVLLLLGGASTSSQLAVLGGAALAFSGLSVLGLALTYLEMSARTAVLVLLGGAALIGLGWLAAWRAFDVPGWASMLTTFVVVVGAWFVFRGEGIIAVVIVGFVGVWGMADGYTSVAVDPNPGAEVRLLALGDSFISGEGADAYFDGTNQVGDDRNECRRSPTAHPYRIAVAQGYGLDFLACSGAKAEDLIECGQMRRAEPRCQPADEWGLPPSAGGVAGERPQLLHLPVERLAEADVVLLSIGGNDVGFSTIVKACLLPRSCAERSEEWFGNVDALGPVLVETYLAVKAAVGDGVPVIVVPYPLVVNATDDCAAGLDAGEYEFIAKFTERLDEVISQAASEAGVIVWAEGRDAYAGRRLCDDDPAVRHLDLDPPNGSPLARYQPGAWVHNSMHPAPDGHALVAAALGPFVAAALENPPAPPAPDPGPDAPATDAAEVTPADTADAAAADDLLTDGEWITDELYRTVRSLLLPIVLVLIGSLTLALGMVNLEPFCLLRPRRGWWKWREDELAERADAEGPDGLAAAV
jgi:hypothetical protein